MSVSLKFCGVVAASYLNEEEEFHVCCLTNNADSFMVLDCVFSGTDRPPEDFVSDGALVQGRGSQAAACGDFGTIHLACNGRDIRPVKEAKLRPRVMRKLLPALLQAAMLGYSLKEWYMYPARAYLDCRACIREWKDELAVAGKLPAKSLEKQRDSLLQEFHSKGCSDMLPTRALDAERTGIPGIVVYIPGYGSFEKGKIFAVGLPPGGPLERPFCAVSIAEQPEVQGGIVEPAENLRHAVCAWIRLNRKALEKYQKADTVKAQELIRKTFRKITESANESLFAIS